MKTNRKTPVTWQRIAAAVEDYVKQHGRKPAVLILHPNLPEVLDLGVACRPRTLEGVRIRTCPLFPEPVLADGNGKPYDV